MSAHRYWRIQCLGVGERGEHDIAELVFRDTPSGPILTGIPISSGFYPGYPPDYAFDGTTFYAWISVDADAWIGLDFGSTPKDIVEYTITANTPQEAPKNFTLSYSDDRVNWTVRDQRLTVSWTSNFQVRTYSVPPPPSNHRYWKLTELSAQGSESNLGLTEIRLLNNAENVSSNITPTSSYSPSSGSLSFLSDNDLGTGVTFSKRDLPKLDIVWDLLTSKEVNDIQLGSSLLQSDFILYCKLQYSDDNLSWSTYMSFKPPRWPGPNSLTTSDTSQNFWDRNFLPIGSKISIDGTIASPSIIANIRGAVYKNAGVHQFEVKFVAGFPTSSQNSVSGLGVGISTATPTDPQLQSDKEAYSIYSNQPAYFAGVQTATTFPFIDGDVVGFVADFTAGSLNIYINGVFKCTGTTNGLIGKRVSPRVCDTSYSANRNVQCILKTSSFDFPITGAGEWTSSARIAVDPYIFRSYEGLYGSTYFPNASASSYNRVPRNILVNAVGNYLDPGNGKITGFVNMKPLVPSVEDLALSSLLFASHFNGNNGSNIFVDEKGHNIVTYGDCKILVDGPAAINPARRSVFSTPGGVGNGIRVPIASLSDPLNLSTGDFTIRTWFYLKEDAILGRYAILDWGGGYNYSWPNIRLQFSANTTLNIALRSSNRADGDPPDIANFVDLPGSFPGRDQWVHLALTREGSLFRLWVAGQKKFEVSSTLGLHNSFNLSGVNIGSAGYDIRYAPSPSDGASSYFDDFQVFNSCLYKADFTPDVSKEFSLVASSMPVSRKVELFRESDGMIVRQVWSDPLTGQYKFEGLNPNYLYTVVAYDYTGQYKAAIISGKKAS